MFRDFLSYFNEKIEISGSSDPYREFILQLGGKSFGKGLFCSFSKEDVRTWTENVSKAFPEFDGKVLPFGYDWLGRCFGIDLRVGSYGKVLMFEIGTLDVLEIPCSFLEFLNKEIPKYSNECLAENYYKQWMDYTEKVIKYGRCAGYKIPLFLGGEDTIENLEDNDLDVYWSVLTQVKNSM